VAFVVKNYFTHDAVQKIPPIRESKQAKHTKRSLYNAFSPQGVTFDHASIFDVLGAL